MTAEYIVGLDNGGTANKFTVMNRSGRFLIDDLIELPSRVTEGPRAALGALEHAFEAALRQSGIDRAARARRRLRHVRDRLSAAACISSKGATNFAHPDWCGFDFGQRSNGSSDLPVVYSNDANAAALYAHHRHFGAVAGERSSMSAIVGTGLGGGVIESGRIDQGRRRHGGRTRPRPRSRWMACSSTVSRVPRCNCGFTGDAESVASLTGIRNNLLPYWLTPYPDHELHGVDPTEAAKQVRGSASAATRWRCRSSSSRRWRSGACSRSLPTSPTPTCTSSAVA